MDRESEYITLRTVKGIAENVICPISFEKTLSGKYKLTLHPNQEEF